MKKEPKRPRKRRVVTPPEFQPADGESTEVKIGGLRVNFCVEIDDIAYTTTRQQGRA
jgi:hypothetical protein